MGILEHINIFSLAFAVIAICSLLITYLMEQDNAKMCEAICEDRHLKFVHYSIGTCGCQDTTHQLPFEFYIKNLTASWNKTTSTSTPLGQKV
jgi:hypothetical protein